MNITQEQKEFIENIIKECPGYRGNEHLLDEFCNEIIRRAYSLISKQNDLDNVRVYVKRIANFAILEVVKNSTESAIFNKAVPKDPVEQKTLDNIDYEFDENGDILLNYDISFEGASNKNVSLSESQINDIKNIILNIDEEDNAGYYKNIFELRYLSGLNNNEIAEKLEIKESEVDKKLLLMLNRVKKEVFST